MRAQGWTTLLAFPLSFALACSDWPGVGDSDAGPASGGGQPEDTSGMLGSSCGSSVSCRTGLTCLSQAPGGLCTKTCMSDDDCQQVGSCQYIPEWGGLICLEQCVADQTCRPQYSCQSTGVGGVCFQAPQVPRDGG